LRDAHFLFSPGGLTKGNGLRASMFREIGIRGPAMRKTRMNSPVTLWKR
jgi:hypothetical protein